MRISLRCPRCRGAVYVERDRFGPRLICRHCAWQRDLVLGPNLPHTRIHDDNPPEIEDGCDASPSCLCCPLPDCLWETPRSRAAIVKDRATLEVFERYKHLGTAKAAELAGAELGLSSRGVYRALERQRKAA
jgi:hypothetical protein